MNKKLLAAFVMFCLLVATNPGVVLANPSYFLTTAETATATSTKAYITAGTGTTTLSIDSNALSGTSDRIDDGLLVFQVQASTTIGLSLKARLEYSYDNQDWYAVNLAPSTSTSAYAGYNEMVFQLSTTTGDIGGSGVRGGAGVQSRIHQAVPIDFLTRYVRVKFYVPIGAPPVSLWAQILPNKEGTR